ncbi:MAG: hypothetical protein AAFV27_02575, partial [Pseudomonadota bacterium]
MTDWRDQFDSLIAPAIARSEVTERLLIDRGTLSQVGEVAASLTPTRRAVVFADTAGFSAAGTQVCEALT